MRDAGTALAAPSVGVTAHIGGNIFMKDSTHDKMEGKWDETKGKVKEEAGKLGGDRSTEIGGKFDQAKGKAKQGLGEVKEEVEELDKPYNKP
jgi:uncharacterized protein YjbJ (UPF0337 family)